MVSRQPDHNQGVGAMKLCKKCATAEKLDFDKAHKLELHSVCQKCERKTVVYIGYAHMEVSA